MNFRFLSLLAVGAALVAQPLERAQAQSTATDQADMTFRVIHPLTTQTVRQLHFGPVGPGVPKTIAPGDPRAAAVEFTGEHLMDVKIQFQTPSTLSSGANTMPFEATAHFWATAADTPILLDLRGTDVGAGYFDPAQLKLGAMSLNGALTAVDDLTATLSTLTVNLGGTVSPSQLQPRGAYTGQIVVTMNYVTM